MEGVILALTLIIFSSVLLVGIRWMVKRYLNQQILKRYGIPGPKPNFFYGHLHKLREENTPHRLIDVWFKMYGNIFGYYMGDVPYIVVNDFKIIKNVSNIFYLF